MFGPVLLSLGLSVFSLTDSVVIYPDPPYEEVPVILVSTYENIQGSEGENSSYSWSVNGEIVKAGTCPNTFRLACEQGFQPDDGDVVLDSLGAQIVPGRFGSAVHIGLEPSRLAYAAEGNISTDSGSVSLWFALDEDIDSPIYDDWNRLFEYRLDDNNALYIEINRDGDRITGVSQSGGAYYGTWTPYVSLSAGQWHHLVWTWNVAQDRQRFFMDGLEIGYSGAEYHKPLGAGDLFLVGCGWWTQPNGAAAYDEFRLFNRALTEEEVSILYTFPDMDIDAMLEADHFTAGDEISCSYQYFDGEQLQPALAVGPVVVQPNPISSLQPPSDVLPVGTNDVTFSVTTPEPGLCRCDTVDKSFDQMSYTLMTTDDTEHSFSLPAQVDVPYSFHIRCAPLGDGVSPWPVVKRANYRVLRDYDPDYPRIFSMWWYFDPQANTVSDLSQLDLAIFSPSQVPEGIPSAARHENPHLKVLVNYSFSYGGAEDELFQAVADEPDHPLYNCVLCDPQGNILYEGYWGHTMYNLTNPACIDYMAELIIQKWQNDCLVFDGIYFDRVQGAVSFMWPEIDIDQDGLADSPEEIDSAWREGVIRLLALLRESIPNAIICGNDALHEYAPWMHGRLFEMGLNAISASRMSFRPFIEEYMGWTDIHRQPWPLPLMTGQGPDWLWDTYGTNPWETCPAETVQWVQEQYDRMRFGLCSALMGEGLYFYSFGTTWWGHLWWYDEYDAPLGYPISEGFPLSNLLLPVYVEDFESGTLGYFQHPPWSSIATLTIDQGEVISGQASVKAVNTNPASLWNEFLWSQTSLMEFEPNTTYRISWTYRILEEADEGYFYAILRQGHGAEIFDIWSASWDPPTGTVDSLSYAVDTDSRTGYYLIFGMKYDAGIVLDDIRIDLGGEPVWRRDFTDGIVLVNPERDTATVQLEKTYRAIYGQQDPVVNHGGLVSQVVLPPYDGRILLNVSQEPMKGDVNRDGIVNILDVVRIIGIILGLDPPPTEHELWAADCNGDGEINILDVVGVVNVILGYGSCEG